MSDAGYIFLPPCCLFFCLFVCVFFSWWIEGLVRSEPNGFLFWKEMVYWVGFSTCWEAVNMPNSPKPPLICYSISFNLLGNKRSCLYVCHWKCVEAVESQPPWKHCLISVEIISRFFIYKGSKSTWKESQNELNSFNAFYLFGIFRGQWWDGCLCRISESRRDPNIDCPRVHLTPSDLIYFWWAKKMYPAEQRTKGKYRFLLIFIFILNSYFYFYLSSPIPITNNNSTFKLG